MLKKFTAGNDVHITWNITKNEQTNLDNITVALYDVFKKAVPFEYEVLTDEDDLTHIQIKGVYKGKDQKTFGKYAIVLFNNYGEDNMSTLCFTEAFIIVHALKNRLSSWGDPVMDSAQNLEIDSNLKAELTDDAVKDVRVNGVSVLNDGVADLSINDYGQEIDNIFNILDENEEHFDNIADQIYDINSSLNQYKDELINDEYIISQTMNMFDSSINDIYKLLQKLDASVQSLFNS